MKPIRRLIATAAASAVVSSAALAHGGHAVPAGVPEVVHLHLAQGLTVPGSVVLGLMLALVAIGTIVWRRRAARSGKAARGSDRRND